MSPSPRYLALDVGVKRTGVAFADESYVPVISDTLKHNDVQEFIAAVEKLLRERNITHLIIGLPLLPSGKEGEQVRIVRDAVSKIAVPANVTVHFLDERYTTPRSKKHDPDAIAACELLTSFLDRQNLK